MQELRFVLIIVGALAIAALLFHGLWSSKKEGQKKFGDRPLGKLDEKAHQDEEYVAPEDDFEIIRKTRSEPDFGLNQQPAYDPLDDVLTKTDSMDSEPESVPAAEFQRSEDEAVPKTTEQAQQKDVEDDIPSFTATSDNDEFEKLEPKFDLDVLEDDAEDEPLKTVADSKVNTATEEKVQAVQSSEPAEPEMQVIVLNVHSAGAEDFVGTQLFDSMRQNGLIYGEMDIFHRHADLSGTGKVLFSVANMMQPGTLQHDDPATFTTKGISFFMTLPCFGEAEQNFKLMLRTAQQIADDLGGNVLDDKRNLMTPNRLDAYRKQIQDFNAAKASA
ncbi:cell division protein ZipA [Vibrio parahaemolyticus]|uniref:cell division protein ZipA n=1 Tax=Vibrio mediterranei TaxID=689 RepID=UPI00406760D1